MNLNRILRKCKACYYIMTAKGEPSFSQVGEDLIIHYLFKSLKILRPSYLDIGANYPVLGNNTFFFYSRGSRGVCVEPDPKLYLLLKNERPSDTILHAGVGIMEENAADLYVFPQAYSGWNTFSKKDAEQRQAETGVKIKEIIALPLVSINRLMAEYFDPYPNLISVDVEGLDLSIIKTIDFNRFKPEVICAESISFDLEGRGEKTGEINDFLFSKGYFAYADTHVNTIFCRQDVYKNRNQ